MTDTQRDFIAAQAGQLIGIIGNADFDKDATQEQKNGIMTAAHVLLTGTLSDLNRIADALERIAQAEEDRNEHNGWVVARDEPTT